MKKIDTRRKEFQGRQEGINCMETVMTELKKKQEEAEKER